MENVSTKRMDKRASAKDKSQHHIYSSKHIRLQEALLQGASKNNRTESTTTTTTTEIKKK
jgi:hypothetical protein